MVLEESGDIKRALDELEKFKDSIVDKEEWKVKRADYLIKLNRLKDATDQYTILVKGNPDNWNYYLGLFKATQLVPFNLTSLRASFDVEPSTAQKLVEVCESLAKEHTFSKIPRQIPLSFLSGDVFRQKFQKFVYPNLTKGVPALFVLVKQLYNDHSKVKIIEEVFLEIEKTSNPATNFLRQKNSKNLRRQFYGHGIFWRNILTAFSKLREHSIMPKNVKNIRQLY